MELERWKDDIEKWIFGKGEVLTADILLWRLAQKQSSIRMSMRELHSLLEQCCSLWAGRIQAWYIVPSVSLGGPALKKLPDGTFQVNYDPEGSASLVQSTTWKLVKQEQMDSSVAASLYCIHSNEAAVDIRDRLSFHFSDIILKKLPKLLCEQNIIAPEPLPLDKDPILQAFAEDEENLDAPLCRAKRPCTSVFRDDELDQAMTDFALPDVEVEQVPPVIAQGIYTRERTLDDMISSSNEKQESKKVIVQKHSWVNGYLVTESVPQDAPGDLKENRLPDLPKREKMVQKQGTVPPKQGSILQFFGKK